MIVHGSETYRDGDLQFLMEQDGREYRCGVASYILDNPDRDNAAATLARNWSLVKDGFNKLVGPAYHRLA
ncbi:hypothetical protein [Sphingobium sp. KCTC 72723]|uniref:hypothetical protein n=1 Tax=Sphingobium sp. KCTC 72723 TaxID=2733867 RepID=UPI00165DFC9F|nr:hypothetical protein [Sphingobium sp. KCTC 72723]